MTIFLQDHLWVGVVACTVWTCLEAVVFFSMSAFSGVSPMGVANLKFKQHFEKKAPEPSKYFHNIFSYTYTFKMNNSGLVLIHFFHKLGIFGFR